MSTIISRASWGARFQDGYGNRPVGSLAVYGHHSVTGHSGANATYAQDCAAVRTVEQVGQNIYRVGMSYTFLIPPSGRIFQGVSIGRVSAHTINRNTGGAGVCFIGNYERESLTAAQLASAAWLLDHGQKQGWWTTDRFTALHRDVFATSCPGGKAVGPLRAVRAGSGGSSGGGSTNELTGFLRATKDTELRSGPLSTHKKVRDVKSGELLIGSGQDSQWWTGVGDLWVPKSAVEKRSSGGSSDVLHHGQWPDRDLPLTADRTREFFKAWEDLLRRTGDWNDRDGSVHAAIKRWLRGARNPSGGGSGIGYGVGWGPEMTGEYGRGLKRALRDRGFFQGDVSTGAWTDDLTRAEKAFLNDQRRHLRPQPPSATTHTRGYDGKVH